MNMLRFSTELVKSYKSRGFGFTQFYSPEDTEMFMRMARNVAEQTKPGVILDIGTGSAIPLIHAIGNEHYGFGVDKDECSIRVAIKNTKLFSQDRISIINADINSVYGSFDIVMSNPPYIPCEGPISDEALEVLGDGTSFIENIFHRFAPRTKNFVIHFASITNPCHILEIAAESGFFVNKAFLGATQFGIYTSEQSRLAYLLKCRNKGESIFFTKNNDGEPLNIQLLITCHFTRQQVQQARLRSEKICSILKDFSDFGLYGLRLDDDMLNFIKIGLFPDCLSDYENKADYITYY